MARKNEKKTETRNAIAVLMDRRFRGKGGPMKDRRARRGGARNEQAEHLKEAAE